ncbi:hypothetical protein ACWD6R_03865 [Streptomyces sp. NPDC005151]
MCTAERLTLHGRVGADVIGLCDSSGRGGRCRSGLGAQYPYLLGTHVPIADAAAPDSTLWVLVGVACAAVVLIVPSLVLLFSMYERGRLGTRT